MLYPCGRGEALRYRDLETALGEMLGIKRDAMGAFRAKLRHLRNIGLAHWPKPGSGQQIDYSKRQALEILVALKLGDLGQAPKNAAILAESIVRQSPWGQHDGHDCLVVMDPDRLRATHLQTASAVAEFMKSPPDVYAMLNVSALVRKLEGALNRLAIG
jgi:hypothetical protein